MPVAPWHPERGEQHVIHQFGHRVHVERTSSQSHAAEGRGRDEARDEFDARILRDDTATDPASDRSASATSRFSMLRASCGNLFARAKTAAQNSLIVWNGWLATSRPASIPEMPVVYPNVTC